MKPFRLFPLLAAVPVANQIHAAAPGTQAVSASYGGGLMFTDGGAGIVNASVIANHGAGKDCYRSESAGTLAFSHALVEDAGSCGVVDGENGNIVGVDPALGALADHGGPAFTHLPQAGSPLIGAVEVGRYLLAVSVTGQGGVSAAATPTPLSGGIAACTQAGGANCAAAYPESSIVGLAATYGGDGSHAPAEATVALGMQRPIAIPAASPWALALLALLLGLVAARRRG